MHGLVTNYFSATHDKQLLMIFYAKCLLTTNIVKAQHVFNHVKKDISFYINWEEKVLLPLSPCVRIVVASINLQINRER